LLGLVHLTAIIREMMESFSCHGVFRANAGLILEGVRGRSRKAGGRS
jgi:hypothetical protein